MLDRIGVAEVRRTLDQGAPDDPHRRRRHVDALDAVRYLAVPAGPDQREVAGFRAGVIRIHRASIVLDEIAMECIFDVWRSVASGVETREVGFILGEQDFRFALE